MEKGEFFKLEKEAVLLNAKDVEGVYNAIQDLRDENGSIEKSYKSIQEERNNLYSQKHEIKEEIEKDIYANGEIGQKLKQQKEKIDEIEKQNEENIKEANEKNSGDCPKCGEGKLVKRRGKYGPFIGCNNFPKCNHTQKIAKAKTTPTEGEHHKYEVLKSQLKQEVDKVSLENPRIQKLNKQITELDKKYSLARYVNEYENPSKPYRESTTTPIEKYYKLRKESDKKVYDKIGEHKIALSSIPHGSQNLTSVSSKEIKADLSVDKDGNINNLYLERNNDGKPIKVLKINNIDKEGPNLLLENGEELTYVNITNWNMRRYYSTNNNDPDFNPGFTGPNSWKMYATKPDGETYEGYKKVDVFNRDSSD